MTLSDTPGPLKAQILAAAERFADDARPVADLLAAIADDVDRALAEPLEIFPVCHHSPASAVHMIGRLRQVPPKVIFMEMCDDLRPLCEKLADCKLPVAFQAFAGETDAFPLSWTPLSVVAPFTEFSAEFQAIAFALSHSDCELVFVDRSVDHIFQWMPQKEDELEKHIAEEPEDDAGPGEESDASHGAAVGVQIGHLEPTFEAFRHFLLKNARVRHFSEWWDQYVEQAVIGRDYGTYRRVMCLIGSLLRRLGRREEDNENDRRRERYMWTRMKQYLKDHKLKPGDAIHICGAVHAASDVEEFGTRNKATWDIPEPTKTKWLYGMVPSGHAAIEHQFGFPAGTVTLSDASWQKAQKALGVTPFDIQGKAKPPKSPPAADESMSVTDYLSKPPELSAEDEEQLLAWSVGVVKLARRHGYLTSTADSIAVYQTSVMLAQMRNRPHPTAYDFRDAAVTCLEKDRTPKKRNISRLCEILLGGDRVGRVGYESLPPLAQNVYDRLGPLGINLQSSTIQRALLDLRQNPELLPCSDLLWKLRYLLQDDTFRPIMGERKLGHTPTQESWDIALGKRQTSVIQLGYEGVTVEHVLEKRLKLRAFAADAKPAAALEAAEDCILYLKSRRLADEIGEHAIGLLVQETGAQDAPEIFERVRRLVHYHRSTPDGLPHWLKNFVTAGYSHYCTLLPAGFPDRGTSPEQVAGMLAFVFQLESLALSLGCNRSQLIIAVKQAEADDPNKLGLLWSAEWLLKLRDIDSIRDFFNRLLANPAAVSTYPGYINGFLLALKFTSQVGRLVVELLSRAFGVLPDRVLMPWLPNLIMTLKPHGEDLVPTLLKEAAACFPGRLDELAAWQAPWDRPEAPKPAPSKRQQAVSPVANWLRQRPAAVEAAARLLGREPSWAEPAQAGASDSAAGALLQSHPAAAAALAALLW